MAKLGLSPKKLELESYMKFSVGDRCNATLGGERSILLSYRDLYEIELVTITFGFELIG